MWLDSRLVVQRLMELSAEVLKKFSQIVKDPQLHPGWLRCVFFCDEVH